MIETLDLQTSPTACDAGAVTFTVRDAVFDLMRRFNLTSVFANPGSTELPMFRDFPAQFRYVLGLQEATVVGMADGYAQATHNAALVNLHSAAGVGNAMGNLFTAHKNRTPLVIVAGQQARAILPFEPFLCSSQATELPKPYVKWSIEPARAQDVPLAIARAYYIAMMPPRGPVLVSVPVDDWDQPAEPVAPRLVSDAVRPQPSVLDKIGAMLDASERPAIVVGAAVDRDNAWDDIVALAQAHNARVWAAPMSGRCSFPEDHRLFAGFLPAMREKIVSLLAGHDVILVAGAPAFAYHVEGAGPHIPEGAALCQLTEDPDTAAWTPVGTTAVGSLRLSLRDLLARPAPAPRPLPAPRPCRPAAAPDTPMTTAFVLQTLAEVRGPDDIVVEEAPSARPVMQMHLPHVRPETFYTMDSGGLGYGMPAAVGVALGKPGKRVVALIGDGSSMYSLQALWSARQHNLPITFLILNNGRYAALQDFAPVFGFSAGDVVEGTELPGLDFPALAAGMGCRGMRIDDPHRLRSALTEALTSGEPVLIEVPVV
ncbi:Benzoylformate decarboxylase [Achromobacter deleyi]|uniref:Benzoylformate decarboxylase n=1 Tax=Achromobacter deleyi TaxID=1353891 RepID=A0A6S6ZRD7_9BURK|nr:benzoylformate decarboxylase [Achromobacter deleyi]CAB3681655.1 Benzoylformate decarboxylase [Achromobacter deleyi]CAB3830699.1 Benzoylformate decarboxylase [Achromobacter deleyi]CAB3861864.1 Benzoylformate decarboxylase [Achromobacter deleyi]